MGTAETVARCGGVCPWAGFLGGELVLEPASITATATAMSGQTAVTGTAVRSVQPYTYPT